MYKKFNKFVNVVIRKFKFQHEHHNLFNNLLYYLHINKPDSLNTTSKLIKNDKLIETPFKENNNKNNKFKESGNNFKQVAYGKNKNSFTLKQLLFIGNEKNDNLNVHDYRNKYNEISKQKIDELFEAYDNNNILGLLVQYIYILLKNELGKDFNSILDSLIVSKEDSVEEDIFEDIKNDLSLQEELEEIRENNNNGESNDPLERFAK